VPTHVKKLPPAEAVPSEQAVVTSRRGPKSGPETREKLLNVAEELFAKEGIGSVSLRRIMDAAQVGASQLNYHFGTKAGLLRALFERKLVMLNKERMSLLDEAMAKRSGPALEDILNAYFLPSFRQFSRPEKDGNFARLVARVGSDPSDLASEIAEEFLNSVQRRFVAALQKALPGVPRTAIYWRLHVLMCVSIHTLTNPMRIYKLSGGACDPGDADQMYQSLLPILLHGIGDDGAG